MRKSPTREKMRKKNECFFLIIVFLITEIYNIYIYKKKKKKKKEPKQRRFGSLNGSR